jgi:exopolysaccharide production protein ExoZ
VRQSLHRTLSSIYELPSNRRIIPVEGLRGLAVLLVFFVHFNAAFGDALPHGSVMWTVGRVLWANGNAGVDLFFLLSGYLIYGGLIAKPSGYWKYLRRRVERIYPTFLAVFGIYLALSLAFPEQSKIAQTGRATVPYLIENLLLLPGIFPIKPIVTVAWSLSYEFAFYLVVPILVGALALRAWTSAQRVRLFIGVTALIAVAYGFVHSHLQVIMFVAGALVFEYAARRRNRADASRLQGAAAVILAVTVPVLFVVELRPDLVHQWVADGSAAPQLVRSAFLFAGFGCLVLACLTPGTVPERMMSWAPIRWLGNMSYSYYLLHGLTINAFAMVAAKALRMSAALPVTEYWALMAAAFAATIVTSTLLFLAVERPLSLQGSRRRAPIVTPRSETAIGGAPRPAPGDAAPM